MTKVSLDIPGNTKEIKLEVGSIYIVLRGKEKKLAICFVFGSYNPKLLLLDSGTWVDPSDVQILDKCSEVYITATL